MIVDKKGAARAAAELRSAVRSMLAGVGLAATVLVGQAAAAPTALTLINGWTNGPFSTNVAGVENIGGVIHFQGAIATAGTNSEPFILPAGFRPPTNVYVQVDLCNATKGRLLIEPTGDVVVQAETDFSDAQCFTSLDGANFSKTGSGYTAVSPINGWTGAPFGTAAPSIKNINSVIQFRGAISTTGTNTVPFVLPKAFRPKDVKYIPVDMCNATKGRVIIQPNGSVSVQAENDFSNAACFTSLDGVSFETGTMKVLPLLNGWTTTGFSTSAPSIKNLGGVVHFRGAISTTGTTTEPFKLPKAFRPTTSVYVPVDLCNATNGRLLIQPSGDVTVQAETDFSNAQCFTSLEGASFVK